jgi:nucleotide-binding universal stress UspA family protein
MRYLVPCDGSLQSLRAVTHVIRLAAGCADVRILLLNVREPADNWEVRRFHSAEEVARRQQQEGEADLEAARALLDGAGVDYGAEVAVGPVAETIAARAREQGCDHIVMGTHGRTGLATLLLGSVASAVVSRTDLPVTLIR